MKNFSSYFSFLVLVTAVLPAQTLVHKKRSNALSERNTLSGLKRRATTTNDNTCPPPKPYTNGAILKWRKGRNGTFRPGDEAEFVCDKAYRQIGWLNVWTCQKDGSWNTTRVENGYCLPNFCNGSKPFKCADGSKTLDICLKCNCIADCPDASDELLCGSTLVNVTGNFSGVIEYPDPSPGNSLIYTGPMNCSRTLWTDDPGFYIKLLFQEFSMSLDCKNSYVSLENARFTDLNREALCCNDAKKSGACRFDGKTILTSPPLSRSTANWLTVTSVTERSKSPYMYSAKWFNVNKFFPNGVVPGDDLPYPTAFTPFKAYTTSPPGPDNLSSTLAIVLFAVMVFSVGFFLSCKLGKRFIGPSCSWGYVRARIAFTVRRGRRMPESPSYDDQVSPLTMDTDSPFTGDRLLVRPPAPDNRSASSLSEEGSGYGSTENVMA